MTRRRYPLPVIVLARALGVMAAAAIIIALLGFAIQYQIPLPTGPME